MDINQSHALLRLLSSQGEVMGPLISNSSCNPDTKGILLTMAALLSGDEFCYFLDSFYATKNINHITQFDKFCLNLKEINDLCQNNLLESEDNTEPQFALNEYVDTGLQTNHFREQTIYAKDIVLNTLIREIDGPVDAQELKDWVYQVGEDHSWRYIEGGRLTAEQLLQSNVTESVAPYKPDSLSQQAELLEFIVATDLMLIFETPHLQPHEKYYLLSACVTESTEQYRRTLDKLWSMRACQLIVLVTLKRLNQICQQELEFLITSPQWHQKLIEIFVEHIESMYLEQDKTRNNCDFLTNMPHPGWRNHPAFKLPLEHRLEVPTVYPNERLSFALQVEILLNECDYLAGIEPEFVEQSQQVKLYLKHHLPTRDLEIDVIANAYHFECNHSSSVVAFYTTLVALADLYLQQEDNFRESLYASYELLREALERHS